MRKSLGLLEIKGLASAIRVADTMAKAASVQMLGIEPAKGGGWMTIKVLGDVAAVQASLSSGQSLAKQLNCFVAQAALTRPEQQVIDQIVSPAPSVSPVEKPSAEPADVAPEECLEPQADIALMGNESEAVEIVQPETIPLLTPPVETSSAQNGQVPDEDEPQPTCNLCNDPRCSRLKGEPHVKCLHYGEDK